MSFLVLDLVGVLMRAVDPNDPMVFNPKMAITILF